MFSAISPVEHEIPSLTLRATLKNSQPRGDRGQVAGNRGDVDEYRCGGCWVARTVLVLRPSLDVGRVMDGASQKAKGKSQK